MEARLLQKGGLSPFHETESSSVLLGADALHGFPNADSCRFKSRIGDNLPATLPLAVEQTGDDRTAHARLAGQPRLGNPVILKERSDFFVYRFHGEHISCN